jgi:hypothetical protein
MRFEVAQGGEGLHAVEVGPATELGEAPPSRGPKMGDTFPRSE